MKQSAAPSAPDSATVRLPWWQVPWWLALLVAAGIALGYGLASAPNEFIYDDVQVILDPPAPQSLGDVGQYFSQPHFPGLAYYRPVVRTTLLVQKALHGENPLPFHLFNAIVAGLVCLAAYGVLRRPQLGVAPLPALLAAALFALHPVAADCVYPAASGRETLLPGLFSLLALGAFLRPGWRWTGLSLLCFTLAVFGKEQAVVLLPLFVLADVLGLAGTRERWQRVVRYGGMAVVVAVYLTIRQQLFGGSEFHLVLFDRLYGPLLSLLFACQSLLTPFWDLAYEPPVAVWWSWPRLLVALGVLGLLAWAVWRQRERVGRWAFLGAAWFVVTQLPTANVFIQEAPFSERYVFLGSFGLFGVAAAVVSPLMLRPDRRRWVVAVGVVLVALAAAISFHRAEFFRSTLAFHQQWAKSNPVSEIARMGLAEGLVKAGRTDEALVQFREALRIHPGYAEAHFNLGNLLADLGRRQDALASYQRAWELKPELVQARINAGDVHRLEGRWAEAAASYQAALEQAPQRAEVRLQLARVLARQGRSEEAVRQLAEVSRLAPADAELRLQCGNLLADLGQGEAALAEYREALRLRAEFPEAHYNLGTTLLALGRGEEAVAALRQALVLRPDYAEAHINLGGALAAAGQLDEALAAYTEGVRLKPDDATARLNLGIGLLLRGRLAEALEHLQAGVRLNPEEPRAYLMFGRALERAGQRRQAAASYYEALRRAPNWPDALTALAWLLASAEPDLRDGAAAVKLAEMACRLTGNRDLDALNALAAAHAAAGQAQRAVAVAQQALDLARQAGVTEAERVLQSRLDLYRTGRALPFPVAGS